MPFTQDAYEGRSYTPRRSKEDYYDVGRERAASFHGDERGGSPAGKKLVKVKAKVKKKTNQASGYSEAPY